MNLPSRITAAGVPAESVSVIIDSISLDADRMRLGLGHGSPLDSVRVERGHSTKTTTAQLLAIAYFILPFLGLPLFCRRNCFTLFAKSMDGWAPKNS